MFKTILVPTDGSPLSQRAEDAAIAFARASGATLVALAVAEPLPSAADSGSIFVAQGTLDPEGLLAQARQRAQAVVDRARSASVPCECSVALSYYPHEEILRAASDFRCDAIFMASHGFRGLKKLFLGSETLKVLTHASLPVMVFR
jgi:nucleotide-binding universal stress UspA family protein